MKYFILIFFLISLKSFSQDNTNNVDTINLCNALKIDSSDINCDTIIYNENNIQEQEFEIIIPHDSLKKKVVIDKKLYKLNKEEFLNEYGTSDTSIAIINLFFKKRAGGFALICAMPIASSVSGFVGMYLMLSSLDSYSEVAIYFGIALIVVSAIIYYAFPIVGVCKSIKWSRKTLYLTLKDYNENNILPKFVINKLKVKKY